MLEILETVGKSLNVVYMYWHYEKDCNAVKKKKWDIWTYGCYICTYVTKVIEYKYSIVKKSAKVKQIN